MPSQNPGHGHGVRITLRTPLMAGVKGKCCDLSAVNYRNLPPRGASRGQCARVRLSQEVSKSKDDIKKGGHQLCPPGTCTLVEEKSQEIYNARHKVQRNDERVLEEEPGTASWRTWRQLCPHSWFTHFLPKPGSLFSHVGQTSWSGLHMQKYVPPFPWAI